MLYGGVKAMDIKVHKDFMNPFLFLKLKEIMNSAEFPWFKSRIVPQIDDVQLIHTFFEFDRINSQFFELLDPCITFLKVKKLIRAKANLVLKTNEIQEHGFHINTKGYEMFKTSILYLYYINVYTLF